MQLTERLLQSVTVDGKKIPIRTDFRSWIRFDAALSRRDLPEAQRLALALSAVLKEKTLPQNLVGLMQALFSFYACGDTKTGKKKRGSSKAQVLSFQEDAPLIFAAILSQYGVDLTKKNPHWHVFCAMLKGLPENCPLSKIMAYRGVNLADIKDPKQKRHIKKMKARFQLPDRRTSAEIEGDTADALSLLL